MWAVRGAEEGRGVSYKMLETAAAGVGVLEVV